MNEIKGGGPAVDGGRLKPMLSDLDLLRSFVAVVEAGSFSDAGSRLGVVPSTISKHIAALEAKLGCQLVLRSTKRLSITELGRSFYERCLSILYEVEQAEIEIGEYKAEPQGLLKISAATVFAIRHLSPIFVGFLERYRKVRLDVSLSTDAEDLVARGIDVAIRIADELDPGLIALKLAANKRVYCASPDYLARHGTPVVANDLARHNCLVVRGVSQSARWSIRGADGTIEHVVVSGSFVSDNGDLIRQAALAGVGIAHLAHFMVHDHLASGELVEIFPESRFVASHIYAVYPERRNMPLKTRVFLDYLRQEFRAPPAWAG